MEPVPYKEPAMKGKNLMATIVLNIWLGCTIGTLILLILNS
jgi:hypothetical protein